MKENKKQINEIINQMTLEEKISLLSGKDFWHTKDFNQYGIGSIEVADGPCGIRKQKVEFDHLGFHESLPATAYASGPALAATWDKELFYQTGKALGEECRFYGVDLLLGPSMNIQRSPLCGRNFEYFSEDPYLTGITASEYVKGVQSQGVGTCLKHFAANNQETEREYIDTIVEERTLREIYLCGFEMAAKEAKPWAVMTALNKLNGKYCSENNWLLKQVLRDEWGFEGMVLSDWWGVNDRPNALAAGLDLEMPYSCEVGAKKIMAAIKTGDIKEEMVDEACRNILKTEAMIQRTEQPEVSLEVEKHHFLSRKIAREGIVLLKNEDHILPLSSTQKIAVIGAYAKAPQFRLAGSALVNPTKADIPFDEMEEIAKHPIVYAEGYQNGESRKLQAEEAKKAAKDAEAVVIFAGLDAGMEAEGHDRKEMTLPLYQETLIREVASVQKNVIVVLTGGSALEMPWIAEVKGVFTCFLAGQGMGKAIAELIFGIANPCGRLPITFPKKCCHNPSYFHFPGDKVKVEYKEGIFVGYRYYEKKQITPLFSFGHGLSYTEFVYSNLQIKEVSDGIFLQVMVKNQGAVSGHEVVQLYVGASDGAVMRPEKELKGFEKIFLMPGEEKEVSFHLDARSFAYFHQELKDWYVEPGEYRIILGSSSNDRKQEQKLIITSNGKLPKKITGWSKVGRLRETIAGINALEEMKELIKKEYCEKDLRELFLTPDKQEELDDMRIRFLILNTQTVIHNDRIETYLKKCNQEYLEKYRTCERKLNYKFV